MSMKNFNDLPPPPSGIESACSCATACRRLAHLCSRLPVWKQ